MADYRTYNSDFRDLTDTITPSIQPWMRESANLVSFMNGYVDDSNNSYIINYRLNGKEFPIVVTLKMTFPWSYYEWSGKRTRDTKYFADNVGGGKVEFDGVFDFELLIDPFYFSAMTGIGFKAEADEFNNIPSEKFTLDVRPKAFKKFTKKDIADVQKWIKTAAPKMVEKLQQPIQDQVGRRFDEIMGANEELALKYAPEELKELFVF